MNKKANTLLFILGATVFNILITALFFIALMLFYVKIVRELLKRFFTETAAVNGVDGWVFPLIIIAAIALSFVAYRLILKLLMKKIEVERYFDPLFGRRRNPQD